MAAHAVVVALGLWLMASPAVLGLTGAARVAALVAGPLIAALGVIALSEVTRGVRWANVVLGAALALAGILVAQPWPGHVSAVAAGLLTAALSLARGRVTGRYGGGWRAVVGGEEAPPREAGG
ncbi:MAG TPA: hypothetical protein VFS40_13000 [Gemmatimonadales bacterium]|nr:hypothetical protein [Gemmatimonadales bacterium]